MRDISRLDPFLKFYTENGPSGLARYSLPRGGDGNFGVEGWLVMMVGNSVPYRARHVAAKEERMLWNRRRAEFAATAQRGLTVKEALTCVRDPRWTWNASRPAAPAAPHVTGATPTPVPAFALA